MNVELALQFLMLPLVYRTGLTASRGFAAAASVAEDYSHAKGLQQQSINPGVFACEAVRDIAIATDLALLVFEPVQIYSMHLEHFIIAVSLYTLHAAKI